MVGHRTKSKQNIPFNANRLRWKTFAIACVSCYFRELPSVQFTKNPVTNS